MKRPFEIRAPQFGRVKRRDFTPGEVRAQRANNFARAEAERRKQKGTPTPPVNNPPQFGDLMS
jgi:hypothetical protein